MSSKIAKFRKSSPTLFVVLGVLIGGAFLLCACGGGIFLYADGIQREGVQKMQSLSTTLSQEQVELSRITINGANRYNAYFAAKEGLIQVYEAAVGGRYNKVDANGDPIEGTIQANLVVSALVEAYPEMPLAELTKIVATMIDGMVADQAAYANFQMKRLDEARSFNTWLNSGIIKSFILQNIAGFPNDNLFAYIGGEKVYGREALEYMLRPVISSQAAETYKSGIQEPIPVPEQPNP